MEMDILLFCLMGGIVSADTDSAWQSMVSQPLIACSIAGMLMGDLALGCVVGVLLQLPYLVELPVGAHPCFHWSEWGVCFSPRSLNSGEVK